MQKQWQIKWQDYYDILGVSQSALVDEIKKAYRKMARKVHTDLNHTNINGEEDMKLLNEAYEILNNPDERRVYDSAYSDYKRGIRNDMNSEINDNQTDSHTSTNAFHGYEDFFNSFRDDGLFREFTREANRAWRREHPYEQGMARNPSFKRADGNYTADDFPYSEVGGKRHSNVTFGEQIRFRSGVAFWNCSFDSDTVFGSECWFFDCHFDNDVYFGVGSHFENCRFRDNEKPFEDLYNEKFSVRAIYDTLVFMQATGRTRTSSGSISIDASGKITIPKKLGCLERSIAISSEEALLAFLRHIPDYHNEYQHYTRGGEYNPRGAEANAAKEILKLSGLREKVWNYTMGMPKNYTLHEALEQIKAGAWVTMNEKEQQIRPAPQDPVQSRADAFVRR